MSKFSEKYGLYTAKDIVEVGHSQYDKGYREAINEVYNILNNEVCSFCKHRGLCCVSCNEKGYEIETLKELLKHYIDSERF